MKKKLQHMAKVITIDYAAGERRDVLAALIIKSTNTPAEAAYVALAVAASMTDVDEVEFRKAFLNKA